MDVETWSVIFGAIVAISTCVYVFFTWKMLNENKLMREALIEPQMIFYLEATENHADLFYIKIQNIGAGIAKMLRFEISQDLEFEGVIRRLRDIPLFSEGFNSFPPGYKDEYLLFSSQKFDRQDIEKAKLIFKASYKSINGNLKEEWYTLKFSQIAARGNLKPPGSYIGNISYRLEKIDKHIEKIVDLKKKENQN
ncbi:hypothetical protein E9993_20195 [Labilibacter sediminis]|nr:hypothetical protein E9993_20195 [Labilibacter sediminis]